MGLLARLLTSIFGGFLVALAGLLLIVRHQPINSARLIFVSDSEGYAKLYHVQLDHLTTTPQVSSPITRLTRSTAHESYPIISEDRRYVLYSAAGSRAQGIFQIGVQGGEPQMLIPGRYKRLAWIPQSDSFSFSNDHLSTFYRADFSGRMTELLTAAGGDLIWSPDGKWMIYSRRGTLYRQAEGSSTEERISDMVGSSTMLAWSPDGEWVAFIQDRTIIYKMRPDGSDVTRLARGQFVAHSLGWLPDSRWLVISATGLADRGYNFHLVNAVAPDSPLVPLLQTDGHDQYPVMSTSEMPLYTAPILLSGISLLGLSLVPRRNHRYNRRHDTRIPH